MTGCLPEPIVATMPCEAIGYLYGIFSSSSTSRTIAAVSVKSYMSSGVLCRRRRSATIHSPIVVASACSIAPPARTKHHTWMNIDVLLRLLRRMCTFLHISLGLSIRNARQHNKSICMPAVQARRETLMEALDRPIASSSVASTADLPASKRPAAAEATRSSKTPEESALHYRKNACTNINTRICTKTYIYLYVRTHVHPIYARTCMHVTLFLTARELHEKREIYLD